MNKSGTFNIILVVSFLLSSLGGPLAAQPDQNSANFSININTILEKINLWIDGIQEVTTVQEKQGLDEIFETETMTPTIDIILTETTVPNPTETPEPTLSATLIPTVTISPTLEPTLETGFMAYTVDVSFDPDPAAPGDVVTATWTINNDISQVSSLELWFYLPKGFIPIKVGEGSFDTGTNLLIVPVKEAKGLVSWMIEGNAQPPFDILVEVHHGGNAISSLTRTLEERGPDLITKDGGEAYGFNRHIKVNFPSGALPESADVQVRAPKNIEKNLEGKPFELTAIDRKSGVEIKKFDQPVTISVEYSDEEATRQLDHAGMKDESSLTLFYFDESISDWVPLSTTVDSEANLLTATSDHFTLFDFKAQNWEAARLPNLEGFQVSGFTGAGTYSYPIQVPPGPGGLQPSLTLNYNSQELDSATSKGQASWVGMGWSLDTGYIQRNMNGTPNYFGDDTFTLVMNGVSGLLLPIADQDGDTNTIDYHFAAERHWRVRQYLAMGDVGGYPGDHSQWVVFAPDGTQYYFGNNINGGLSGHAFYPAYPNGCASIIMQTWGWYLTRVRNIYGKELTYSYVNEVLPKYGNGCSGYQAYMAMAMYPYIIDYPNNRYRVIFVRETDGNGVGLRKDYDLSWEWYSTSTVLYMKSKLLRIEIWNDPNGNWASGDEVLIRKYVFGYGENGQQIFTNVPWTAGGKTPTLTSVAEFGLNGASALPTITFTYDSMHLSDVKNGYGGQISFGYDNWRAQEGNDSFKYNPDSPLIGSGEFFVDTFGAVNELNLLKSYYQPGGYYKIEVQLRLIDPDKRLTLGLDEGGGRKLWGDQITVANDAWVIVSSYIGIDGDASQARPLIKINSRWYLGYYKVIPLLTRYRVIDKTYTDEVANSSYSSTYIYEGAAVNDTSISQYVSNDPDGSNLFIKPFTEFRGHNIVTETGPDGRVVKTWYHQDDQKKGQIYVTKIMDSLQVYSQTVYYYASLEYPTENLPHPQNQPANFYQDLKILWVYTNAVENYQYNSDNTFIVARDDFYYNEADQGGTQYGNRTRTISSFWNSYAWVTYRASVTGYYPYVSNGTPEDSRYLTGLQGYTNTYQCTAECDWQTVNLTSSLWYLYDGHTMYSAPPDTGKITGTRTLLRFITPPETNPMYADTSYGYDDWGNRTSITQYSGEADGISFGLGSGARTTTTCFGSGPAPNCTSDGYNTYMAWQSNPLVPPTYFTFDKALGVPTSITDPNNANTTASYDSFGRILTIIRPGDDSNNPTMSMSYHEASAPFLNNPFWTEARQRITGSTYFTIRKYYNGIGQMLQTQVVGATIGTSTSDILTDTFYDAGGRVAKQSVPYDVATGSNYHIQNTSIAHTETSYDFLGRPTTSLATDGSPTSYNYLVGYSNNTPILSSAVTNSRGYETITQSDIWGRVVLVTPPTGPVVNYGYDAADHLITVVRGGATTTLNYDFGGRKTSMIDPDMGTWSYTYDALGNLATQTDARGCLTSLSYDFLNRPTSKSYSGSCGVATTTVNYTYDNGTNGIGRRTGMSDGSGSTSWSYDPRGRMTQEIKAITGSGTFKTLWGYNSADLVSSMTYPADASETSGEVVNYSYYPQMLLDRVFATNTYYVNNTDYDAAGRIELRDLGGSVGSPVIRQDYTYFDWTILNGQGRLEQITSGTTSPDSLQDLQYTYDSMGNILTIKDYKAGNPQTQTFTYDRLDRLTSGVASGGSGGTYALQNYTYDSTTGNLSSNAGLNYTYNTTSPSPAHGVRRSNGTGGSSKTIKIRAYSTPCNDGVRATMELWVNGSKVATWANIASNWTNYSQSATLSGKDVIDVVFTNDCFGGGYDRNLYVDYVIVDGTTIQAEGGAAILDRGDGTASFDGQNVIMGQEAINWNGALRLVKGEGAFIGGYDGNGNLTSRVVNGAAYLLAYDAENRMVSVSGGVTASFIYDGDGKRVKGTIGTTITTYIGNYLEWSGSTSTMKSYYYAGSTRVAMRTGSSTVNYLLGDHLGSQVITTDSSGTSPAEIRYYPWGKERYTSGTTPTNFRFTGQRQESSFGLYYYGARWYDPVTGRFISPDPIVPGTGEGGNPNAVGYLGASTYSPLIVDYHENQFLYQLNTDNNLKIRYQITQLPLVPKNVIAFDRYAYSFNNPVKYTDPSGHCIWDLCIIEGIGLVEITLLTGATFLTLEATQPGRPEAFAETIVDLGQQTTQKISDIFTQYRYKGDGRTAGEIIGQEKKGSINREFPSEMLGKTADEINQLAREGNRAAQKAQKLLSDQRFDKHQKRGGKGDK